MNEFIEKLIEKIVNTPTECLDTFSVSSVVNGIEYGCASRQNEIIDMINELTEEHNGGWITDRNPTKEECGRYGWEWFQVTIPQVDGLRTAVMQYEYTTIRGKEVSRWKWYGRVSNVEPIAWKPLAEPYKPKGE